jgi:hypothetical protein
MQCKRRKIVLAAAVAVSVAVGATGEDFELNRTTVDGGGEMFMSGGDFELSGTIGQPDAGSLTGGVFTVFGGFWFPQAPADCNVDGGVNLYDYTALEACMSGPNGGLLERPCACFDLDGDGDVDIEDMGAFQQSFNG